MVYGSTRYTTSPENDIDECCRVTVKSHVFNILNPVKFSINLETEVVP